MHRRYKKLFSGATAGTYGSATQVGQVVVDAEGRVTSAANVTITGAAPGGAAGGDLVGTYPDPTINPDAAALSPAVETLTDGATITWALSSDRIRNATVTLGGNRTLAITGAVNGATGTLIVKQDATGSRLLTLPAGSKVLGATVAATPPLSTTANATDVLAFIYDGTTFIWSLGKAAI